MKKEMILPFAILGLTLAFGVICFLVYITGGTPSLIDKKARLTALLLAFYGMFWGVKAQDDEPMPLYGPVAPPRRFAHIEVNAGYNRTLSTDFPQNITEYSPNSSGTNLSGDGYHVGLSFDYLFRSRRNVPKHSLLCTIEYAHISGHNSTYITDSVYKSRMLYGGNFLANLNFQNELSIDIINISVFYNYKFFKNFSIGAGPRVEFRLTDKYIEKISLCSYDLTHIRTYLPGIKTDAKAQSAILYDDKMKNIKTVQLGIPIELRYDIITKEFDIIPYLGYNYNLTNWLNSWKTNSFFAGISISYEI